jgi:eukaryotic-like serine/threonine-protein kinase
VNQVSPELVAQAAAAFGVQRIQALPAGAQKAVEVVQLGDRPFVLKVVALDASSPIALERARREVELLAELDGDHVVRVESDLAILGGDPPSGAAWLEEYLDGADLTHSLFSGPRWEWREVAQMGHQVALGLGAAHAKSVVHRDLSPNNVRRTSSGTFKVMDFGFARHTLRSGLTIAGQPGTPGYASPEHLHAYSGAPTPASDVFAVGILMFAALTGGVPIPYLGDDADYARRLLKGETPDLASLRPDLTGEQREVLDKCLHRQPARRYLNGTRLARALDEFL